jgi:hypothetical protein
MDMTPEERFERIERTLDRMAERSESHEESIREHSAQINEIRELTRENSAGIKALIDAHGIMMMTLDRILESQAETARGMEELRASQKKTEETLQAFIRSLEKGGNGHH